MKARVGGGLFLAGFVVFCASVAFGATPFGLFEKLQAYLGGGVYVGAGSTIATSNKVTYIGGGCIDNDFGAIGAGAANCEDSVRKATVTGARMGDRCIWSTNLGMDGGAGLSIEAQIQCQVTATNTVTFRACAARADAGALDLPDAGWCATTFSHY